MNSNSSRDAGKTKVRRRLNKEGANILYEAFHTQNITRPTQQQKEEILQRIKALPACDYYSMEKLEHWFQIQRAKTRRNVLAPVVANDEPPLNPEAISSLETLYRGTPHASPEIINIWVDFIQTKFKIRPEQVHAWLDAKQHESEDQQSEEPNTPISKHTSPSSPIIGSSAHPAHPQQRQAPVVVAKAPDPTHPPISTNPYFSLLKREPSSSCVLWTNRDDPGPDVQNPAVPQPPRDPLRTELLLAIHEDSKSFKPPPRPSNRDALETGLGPYHEIMQQFLEQANNGLLKKWGFQPESG